MAKIHVVEFINEDWCETCENKGKVVVDYDPGYPGSDSPGNDIWADCPDCEKAEELRDEAEARAEDAADARREMMREDRDET